MHPPEFSFRKPIVLHVSPSWLCFLSKEEGSQSLFIGLRLDVPGLHVVGAGGAIVSDKLGVGLHEEITRLERNQRIARSMKEQGWDDVLARAVDRIEPGKIKAETMGNIPSHHFGEPAWCLILVQLGAENHFPIKDGGVKHHRSYMGSQGRTLHERHNQAATHRPPKEHQPSRCGRLGRVQHQ